MSKLPPRWNVEILAQIYCEHVSPTIFDIARNLCFLDGFKHDTVQTYIKKNPNGQFYYMYVGPHMVAIENREEYDTAIVLNGDGGPTVQPIRMVIEDLLVKTLEPEPHQGSPVLGKLVISSLKKIPNPEIIVAAINALGYRRTSHSLPKDHRPPDVVLVSNDGKEIQAHRILLELHGEAINKIVSDKRFREDEKHNMDFSAATLQWFVDATYTGCYDFSKVEDKIEAVELLDFVGSVPREKMVHLILEKLTTT